MVCQTTIVQVIGTLNKGTDTLLLVHQFFRRVKCDVDKFNERTPLARLAQLDNTGPLALLVLLPYPKGNIETSVERFSTEFESIRFSLGPNNVAMGTLDFVEFGCETETTTQYK